MNKAMFVRIDEKAHTRVFVGSPIQGRVSQELKDFLKENAGKLVQVETDHLFTNQYNVEKFRLFDSQICEVVNDARVGMGKCKYCGKMLHHTDMICMNYGVCPEYGVEWFTEKNTYFLKYPQGYKVTAKTEVKDRKIGSYTLSLDINKGQFEIRNARRRYFFNYDKQERKFIIYDSIGNKIVKYLPDVPMSVYTKLHNCIEVMLHEAQQIKENESQY